MPSIKMKNKLNPGCLSGKNGLHICQKPSMISKKTCSRVRISELAAEIDYCAHNCEDVSMGMPVFSNDMGTDEAIAREGMPHDGISLQPSISVDSAAMDRMDFTLPSISDMETIFSPILETFELQRESNTYNYEGSNDELYMSLDASFNNRSSLDYQTCDMSDFYVSDMILSSLPFNINGDISDINCFQNYKYVETSMLFDITDQYMILPFLEDTMKVSNQSDVKFCEEALTGLANADICHGIEQMKPLNQDFNLNSDSDQAKSFDPQLFLKNIPELLDVVSNFQPSIFPHETQIKKAVTLVLDLDETLVHSTLEHHDDKDFSFTVFFNMKEQNVCVKKRPYLQIFLERVAEMFELVIFTASQSIYAEQVLNRIDPEGRVISRRVYRESCIFSDGSYTKDLTVLGIDLAKVVIIDNNPQVFRLQVNNGIPIKSWFDDPTDNSLLSLLPFLETLVDVEDVRPIIAHRFGILVTNWNSKLNSDISVGEELMFTSDKKVVLVFAPKFVSTGINGGLNLSPWKLLWRRWFELLLMNADDEDFSRGSN